MKATLLLGGCCQGIPDGHLGQTSQLSSPGNSCLKPAPAAAKEAARRSLVKKLPRVHGNRGAPAHSGAPAWGDWLLHTSTLHGEAAQAPTLSCKCGRRGRGLQGECCSCSTMRPVSGMKSAAIRNSAAREESQTFAHKAVPWGRAGGGASTPLHRVPRAETAARAEPPK